MAESAAASGQSKEQSSDDDGGTATVREGVTRAIDPDEIFSVRSDGDLTADEPHARAESFDGFNPDQELERPPDLPESVDLTSMAPDGTTVPDGTFQPTDPFGQTIDIGGGRSVVDSVMSGADAFLGDRLDGGLDFDLTSPGTQDSRPGGQATTGDPSVDRAISAHDGSQISADGAPPAPAGAAGPDDAPSDQKLEDEIQELIEEQDYDPQSAREEATRRQSLREEDYESADGSGSIDSATNLERVTVMQGSQVQPSNNPDDPATGAGSIEGWIPPEDLVTMPAQDGEAAATTLTSAATLRSSPVTNPSDPVLGDDGIITGGSYAGGSGSSGAGGGETTPTVDASAAFAGDSSALADDPAEALGGLAIGTSGPEDIPPPPDPPPGDDPDDGPPGGGADEG